MKSGYDDVTFPVPVQPPVLVHLGYHLALFVCGFLDGRRENKEAERQKALDNLNVQGSVIQQARETASWTTEYLYTQLSIVRQDADYRISQMEKERDKFKEQLEAVCQSVVELQEANEVLETQLEKKRKWWPW